MKLPRLKISPNGRTFCRENCSPFFYLADTAWELFHRTTQEEAQLYLKDRAARGFRVIQAAALAELDGLHTPNCQGDLPLENDDPARPVEAYWRYVDLVVKSANELGMYVGFLPTWGDKWNRLWGIGPEIFHEANARLYGRWLGERYRDAGIIWILGGDRPVNTPEQLRILRAMAEGLREGDDGTHLITLHPAGGRSSSLSVHAESWADFHMIQSGHTRCDNALQLLRHDRELLPARPVVNGEPNYEEHPNAFRGGEAGWLDDHEVRRDLYWAITSGAAGYTYGAHPIWQFYDGKREPVNGPRITWQEALSLPGAAQLRFALELLESRPSDDRQPADECLCSFRGTGTETATACLDANGRRLLIYQPESRTMTIDLSFVKANHIRYRWLNPGTGAELFGGECKVGRKQQFTPPPVRGGGRDLLLVIEDTEM